ncbi:putative dipeptidyl-aminopeptidase B [Beauveria bassiana]|uniref:Putative dipeptidyl-aminopeptidase B n=1 Tax=Beauveria bassiana TaxID=176275 RepID=A0A2N6NT44_BEABA|nr:putative dipeptidyl-aminopeptidase B [Beauveria bassiana]
MPDQDPYYAHLVSVNFDGSMLQVITKGDRSHTWQWGPNRRFLIGTWSRVDYLPRSAVRDAETGKEVVFLQKEQLSPDSKGKCLFYPSNLDETKSYPVVEYIYAGPQDFYTPKAFRPSTDLRALANKGFIVVRSDGMGTNWATRDVSQHLLQKQSKTPWFPDRIAWIRARRQNTRPFYELVACRLLRLLCRQAKTAAAAAAVLHHADFYKARRRPRAGSHDNRLSALLEMFMGYPVDESYDRCSNVTHARAQSFGGALMLCVGGGLRQ